VPIAPPPRGEPYPGRLPAVSARWKRQSPAAKAAIVVPPVVVVAIALALDLTFGVVVAVLVAGSAAATVTYLKNRTDRHNAAVDRGEIPVVADPHFAPVSGLDGGLARELERIGYPTVGLGAVVRFDGGWLVRRRSRTELAVVIGDDGGHAYFDSRAVSDLRAATEYLAGRGRDPATG
jgi:hypothetical protein